jgi:hypothetical protein
MAQIFEMEMVPAPGEALLYVRLSDVANMPICEVLKLLESLGYVPELRYLQWATDPKQVTLFAWLKQETLPCGTTGETLSLWDEYHLLLEKLEPPGAVRYAWSSV